MAKTMIRYDGLQRRETYDEILGVLERGIDIPFPNRQASFIRNSPQYQNLLTLDFVDLQQQQEMKDYLHVNTCRFLQRRVYADRFIFLQKLKRGCKVFMSDELQFRFSRNVSIVPSLLFTFNTHS